MPLASDHNEHEPVEALMFDVVLPNILNHLLLGSATKPANGEIQSEWLSVNDKESSLERHGGKNGKTNV